MNTAIALVLAFFAGAAADHYLEAKLKTWRDGLAAKAAADLASAKAKL